MSYPVPQDMYEIRKEEKKKTFPEFIGSGSTLIEFNF